VLADDHSHGVATTLMKDTLRTVGLVRVGVTLNDFQLMKNINVEQVVCVDWLTP
jgi:hypothetical protein